MAGFDDSQSVAAAKRTIPASLSDTAIADVSKPRQFQSLGSQQAITAEDKHKHGQPGHGDRIQSPHGGMSYSYSSSQLFTGPAAAMDSQATRVNQSQWRRSGVLTAAQWTALQELMSIDMLRFYCMCFLWYSSSASTNTIAKKILNEFKQPLTLTFVQLAIVAILCVIVSLVDVGIGHIRRPTPMIVMTILPLAVFQIVGHTLSSAAMSYISVSFTHTIKALSPLFTVLLYRSVYKIIYSIKVYSSLVPLTLGVMLVCATELTFNTFGVLCALASTGVFVVQNIVSKKIFNNAASKHISSSMKIDKMNMLFYSSFMAAVLMAPLWLYSDGMQLFRRDLEFPSVSLQKLFVLNGISLFAQNILAFTILSQVSPVTYSIASLFKRIFVITSSIIYFGDSVSLLQSSGIALTFFGLWMYNQAKTDVARGEKQISAIQESKATFLPIHR